MVPRANKSLSPVGAASSDYVAPERSLGSLWADDSTEMSVLTGLTVLVPLVPWWLIGGPKKRANLPNEPIFKIYKTLSIKEKCKSGFGFVSKTNPFSLGSLRGSSDLVQGFFRRFKAIKDHSSLFKGFWKKNCLLFTHSARKLSGRPKTRNPARLFRSITAYYGPPSSSGVLSGTRVVPFSAASVLSVLCGEMQTKTDRKQTVSSLCKVKNSIAHLKRFNPSSPQPCLLLSRLTSPATGMKLRCWIYRK